MSDNHDFYWLEKAERLLQDGQPTGEPLLDDLAGTVPLARESFEHELEEQLLLTLHNQAQVETMHVQTIPQEQTKKKRWPLGLPVTLAAAVAVLLLGSLSVFFANLPPSENPLFFSAVQGEPTEPPPDGMMWTATAIIAEATYQAASTQMAQVQGQMDAAQRQMTEQAASVQGTLAGDGGPDQLMTNVVQTATAVIEQATQRAGLDPFAATATALIQSATQDAARLWSATANAQPLASPTFVPTSTPLGSMSSRFVLDHCAESVPVYENSDVNSPIVGQLGSDPNVVIRVDGQLYLVENDRTWLFITVLDLNPVRLHGWVPADSLGQTCTPLAWPPGETVFGPTLVPTGTPFDTAPITMLPPTLVPPATPTPFPSAAASLSPVCPAQQLLLYAQPSQSAPLVGDMPFDATLHIEGSLTLNMGDSWLLVVLQGVRGWLPAQAPPPECIDTLAPQGITALDKLSVPTMLPTVPPPNSGGQPLVFTATPEPSATMTPTLTITPSDTWTPSPTTTPTHTPAASPTFTPTPTAIRMITETVQVRVGNAEELDLEALIGQSVDIYIAVGSEDNLVTVVAARGVTVLEFVEVPMPNETRYVFIEAVILPRTQDQLDLLAGLAQTNMPMKLEPVA